MENMGPVKEEKLDFSTDHHPQKMSKNPKTYLTLEVKGQLIQESKSPGMSNKKLSQKYGISQPQISKILKNQLKILTTLNSNNGSSRLKVCSKGGKFPEVENRLYDWVVKKQNNHLKISNQLMSDKAKEIAAELGIVDFKCSENWIIRFKSRKNLSFRTRKKYQKIQYGTNNHQQIENEDFSDYLIDDITISQNSTSPNSEEILPENQNMNESYDDNLEETDYYNIHEVEEDIFDVHEEEKNLLKVEEDEIDDLQIESALMYTKMENPWNIGSLYDLRYYNCPSCDYYSNIKQKFINHVYNAHPEKIYYLKNIKDGSMDDITCPWNLKNNPHDSNDNNYGFNFENVVTKIEIENSDIENNEDTYFNSDDGGNEPEVENDDIYNKIEIPTEELKVEMCPTKEPMSLESSGKLKIRKHSKIKSKQKFLTLKVKGQVIQESKSPGMTNKKLCEKYGLSASHVSRILKNQARILTKLEASKNGEFSELTLDKGWLCKGGKFPELENRLYDWVVEKQNDNLKISSQIMSDKAKEIAAELGIVDFKCSENWIIRFKSRKNLGKSDRKVERVKCELCDLDFTPFRLKQHMENEHDHTACICEKCGREFESQVKLKKHKFSSHPNKTGIKKKFLPLQVRGQLIQESKAPGMTNKKLSEKYGVDKSCVSKILKNQLRILTRIEEEAGKSPELEKHWYCEVCGKMCKTKKSLRFHIRTIHDKIFNYPCPTCGKGFIRPSTLRKHTQIVHEGIKPFNCEHCGKPFSSTSMVKRHVITVHEGQKNFKCEYCEHAYGQSGDLKRHIDRVHKNKLYLV